MSAGLRVELVDVDESVLAELIEAATTDATADEVTPPLTDGPQWTAARIEWLQQFHRSHRGGLSDQTVWAVLVDGAVAGQVRLRRLTEDGVGETGLWLRRSMRGRGIGTAVVRAVVNQAVVAGLHRVTAETTVTNLPARRTLERAGFTVTSGGPRGLRAQLELPPRTDTEYP
jgi:RimJ/RimL family protein N-acetyltransferase